VQSTDGKGGGFLRGCRERGICAISVGAGILIAMVLPVGVIMFVSALTLILLGLTWMRRR
jgi:hypothetical protein